MLAIHVIKTKSVDRWPSLLLGLNLLILACHALLVNFVAIWGRQNIGGVLIPCLAVSIGPLFFLCFTRAANTKHRFRWLDLVHVFPAALIFFMLLFKRIWMDIDHLIILSFFVYAALLSHKVYLGEAQFTHLSANSRLVFHWLIGATTVMVLAFISEILILNEIRSGVEIQNAKTLLITSIIKLSSLTFLIFAALQNPKLFDWFIDFGTKVTPRPKQLDPERLQIIAHEFTTLVDSNKLFADDTASLKSISTRLGVPARMLSESINDTFKQSFSKYMNVRRVEEAKKLLELSDYSITQLMYEAGFRTKSNFNKEFRAIEGVSPSVYRDRFAKKVRQQ